MLPLRVDRRTDRRVGRESVNRMSIRRVVAVGCLAAGLGLVAGATVSLPGEDAAAGDVVPAGEFVLAAGSHADTNAMARIVVSRSMN